MSRVPPLNNTQIKNAKPTLENGKLKPLKLADGQGLQLKVAVNKTKNWIFNFKCPYKQKATSMSFGIYPEVSLAEAREQRRAARILLAKGLNPKEERDIQKQKSIEASHNTFELIALKWFEVRKSQVKETTAVRLKALLKRHLFSAIGKTPIHQITAPMMINTLTPISKSGRLETVKRLCQRSNEIMNYAVNTGLITSNPLVGIKEAFETPKTENQKTIEPARLPELMMVLQVSEMKIITRCLIEWQLHTMVRPNEAAKAKWRDIDFEQKLWVIPAEMMKTNTLHKVPLTKQTLALLEYIKPISGHREYIFPSHKHPNTHTNTETANKAIQRTSLRGELVSHGLRSIGATSMTDHGFGNSEKEACLSHKVGTQVGQAYDKSTYLNQRIKMMNWWSNHIEEASIGNMSLSSRRGLRLVNS